MTEQNYKAIKLTEGKVDGVFLRRGRFLNDRHCLNLLGIWSEDGYNGWHYYPVYNAYLNDRNPAPALIDHTTTMTHLAR